MNKPIPSAMNAASPSEAPALNGIKATLAHDEGAIAQCSHCGRYSLDPATLSDRQPVCDCGKQHGWSGSFVRPGADSRWSGKAPAAAPVGQGSATSGEADQLNGGMHASIFVKVWGDAGGGDAGRIALAEYAFKLGHRAALAAKAEQPNNAEAPYRVAEFWSSANPGTKVRMLAEGDDIEQWGKRGDFIRWVDAPVAERAAAPASVPEGWRDWIDRAAWMLDIYEKHLYELRPIEIEAHPYVPSIGETANELRTMISAAPEVAQPAVQGERAAPSESIGTDAMFRALFGECEISEHGKEVENMSRLVAHIDRRTERVRAAAWGANRAPGSAVVWWDRAVGGFYLSEASIPKSAVERGGIVELVLATPAPATGEPSAEPAAPAAPTSGPLKHFAENHLPPTS